MKKLLVLGTVAACLLAATPAQAQRKTPPADHICVVTTIFISDDIVVRTDTIITPCPPGFGGTFRLTR
jgi:hypothetical protein